jgi:hypothetical protein
MAGDGEPMGLVADLLDQMHGGGVARQYKRRLDVQQPKQLGARTPIRPLRNPHHLQAGDPELLERSPTAPICPRPPSMKRMSGIGYSPCLTRV